MPKRHESCPQCGGKKTIVCTITEFGSDKPPEQFESTCPTCDGRGTVTPAALRRHKAEVEAWCSCDEPDYDRAVYHPDNERGSACRKHHWTCGGCGKILQVG